MLPKKESLEIEFKSDLKKFDDEKIFEVIVALPMYPYEFANRLSDLRMLDYSALPLWEGSLDDLDKQEIERLKQMISTYGGDTSLLSLSDEGLLKALGLVREDQGHLVPTIAGVLLVGTIEAMKRYVPTATTSFQVLQGSEILINEDIRKPILATIESLETYMAAWNPEQAVEVGLIRVPIAEFNKSALREGIINAFSHRDYSLMGRIRISINDEGLTIANPGGFIDGISVDNLLEAEPHGRNVCLADCLKRIGLAERSGRGIDRIFEGSLLYGKALPDYSKSTSATVNLFILRSQPDLALTEMIVNEQNKLGRTLSLNMLLVLNAMRELRKASFEEIVLLTRLSESIVRNVIGQLLDLGIFELRGSGRSREYMFSASVYKQKGQVAKYVTISDIEEYRYDELVLKLAQQTEFITRSDVVELLHVDGQKAYRVIQAIVKAGRLEAVHKGRYAKYQFVK